LGVGERVAVVEQVLEHGFELLVELLHAGVLVNVQIQKVAEGVMVGFKVEDGEAGVEGFKELLRIVVCGWERRPDFEYVLHYFLGDGEEDVEFDFAVLAHPCSALFEEAWLGVFGFLGGDG